MADAAGHPIDMRDGPLFPREEVAAAAAAPLDLDIGIVAIGAQDCVEQAAESNPSSPPLPAVVSAAAVAAAAATEEALDRLDIDADAIDIDAWVPIGSPELSRFGASCSSLGSLH